MWRHNSFSGRKKIGFQRHFLPRKAISEAKVGRTKEWMFTNYAHVELSEHLISFSDFFLMQFSIFIMTKTQYFTTSLLSGKTSKNPPNKPQTPPPVQHHAHTVVSLQWNSVRIVYIFHVCDSSWWWLSVQRSTMTPPCPPTSLPHSSNRSTRYTLKLHWCPSIKHGWRGHAEFTVLLSIRCRWRDGWRGEVRCRERAQLCRCR